MDHYDGPMCRKGAGGGSPSRPIDDLLAALSDPERRLTLAVLRSRDADAVELEELATAVADRLDRADGDGPDAEDVALRLHHHGLPKLADAGVVDYDPRTETVRSRDVDLLADGPGWLLGCDQQS